MNNYYGTYKYFGYEIKKSKKDTTSLSLGQSFATPELGDGAIQIEHHESGVGVFTNSILDVDGMFKTEMDRIRRYREITEVPEVDEALENIINETIVTDEQESPVRIVLDDVDDAIMSEAIKDMVRKEFDHVCKLLHLDTRGHNIVRDWYIDSKKYYHKIIDEKNPKKGIMELRPLDPTKTRKIREIHKKRNANGIEVVEKIEEYYLHLPEDSMNVDQGIRISTDSIAYSASGYMDLSRKGTVGYLQKALRPANQLKMMEDAVVIYRLARAPERRVFYIDVGSLPKAKAEQYLESMARRYKNKLVYEASTGQVRNDKNHLSMLEDFWLPRREGTSTTEIQTLGGGQNLGEIADIVYFQKKLLKALNVPIGRLEPENGFSLGRASEITRDELKFNKFINRIRSQFSELFYDILKTQIILKNIIKAEDWDAARKDIFFDYIRDSHFTEMKNLEIMTERTQLLSQVERFVGRYFSDEQIMKDILHYDEEEIKEIKKQNAAAKKLNPENYPQAGGGGGGFR